MTDDHGPAEEPRARLDPAQLRASRGCGVVGCMYGAVILAVILFLIVLAMALLRPGLTPIPQMPR